MSVFDLTYSLIAEKLTFRYIYKGWPTNRRFHYHPKISTGYSYVRTWAQLLKLKRQRNDLCVKSRKTHWCPLVCIKYICYTCHRVLLYKHCQFHRLSGDHSRSDRWPLQLSHRQSQNVAVYDAHPYCRPRIHSPGPDRGRCDDLWREEIIMILPR